MKRFHAAGICDCCDAPPTEEDEYVTIINLPEDVRAVPISKRQRDLLEQVAAILIVHASAEAAAMEGNSRTALHSLTAGAAPGRTMDLAVAVSTIVNQWKVAPTLEQVA